MTTFGFELHAKNTQSSLFNDSSVCTICTTRRLGCCPNRELQQTLLQNINFPRKASDDSTNTNTIADVCYHSDSNKNSSADQNTMNRELECGRFQTHLYRYVSRNMRSKRKTESLYRINLTLIESIRVVD